MVLDYFESFVSQTFLTKTWFRNNTCLGTTNCIVQKEIPFALSINHHETHIKTKNKNIFKMNII